MPTSQIGYGRSNRACPEYDLDQLVFYDAVNRSENLMTLLDPLNGLSQCVVASEASSEPRRATPVGSSAEFEFRSLVMTGRVQFQCGQVR